MTGKQRLAVLSPLNKASVAYVHAEIGDASLVLREKAAEGAAAVLDGKLGAVGDVGARRRRVVLLVNVAGHMAVVAALGISNVD